MFSVSYSLLSCASQQQQSSHFDVLALLDELNDGSPSVPASDQYLHNDFWSLLFLSGAHTNILPVYLCANKLTFLRFFCTCEMSIMLFLSQSCFEDKMNCECISPCVWNIVCLMDVKNPGPKFPPIPRADFMGMQLVEPDRAPCLEEPLLLVSRSAGTILRLLIRFA